MDTRVSLHLLGTPALRGPNGPIGGRVAQRHRLAMLGLLAATPGHRFGREKLIGYLWPEADSHRARHLLSVALHELRAALGESVIVSHGDDLELNPGLLEVDLWAFRSAVEQRDWATVARLWSGPFLDGLFLPDAEEFDQWLERERLLLREHFLQALESAGAAELQEGDPLAAVRWFRRAVAEDPLNTRFVLRLLDALEAAGDRGNALVEAAEHEGLLERELGIAPDPEFVARVLSLRSAPTVPHPRAAPAPIVSPLESVPVDALPASQDAGGPQVGKRKWPLAVPVGFMLLIIVGLVARWIRPVGAAPVTRVAVVPFENRTGDSRFDEPVLGAEERIRLGLARLPMVEPVGSLALEGASSPLQAGTAGTMASWIRRARDAGAGSVVTGSVWREGDSLRLSASLLDVADGEALAVVGPLAAHVDDQVGLFPALESRVLGVVASRFDERVSAHLAVGAPAIRYEAYLEYTAGIETFLAGEGVAIEHFLAAALIDPPFHDAHLWAAEAMLRFAFFARADSLAEALSLRRAELAPLQRHALDWLLAELRGDRFGARRSARLAAELAPRSRWTVNHARQATPLGRAVEALALLDASGNRQNWLAGWLQYHRARGSALHATAQYEEELAAVREARSLERNLVHYAVAEASALAALGRIEELAQLVDEALALAPQPNFTAGSLMQQAASELYAHGHEAEARRLLERAIGFYDEQVVRWPELGVNWWAMANVLARLDRWEEAAAIARNQLRPGSVSHVWQAILGMAAAALGDSEGARRWEAALAIPQPRLNVFDAAARTYYRAAIRARLGEEAAAMDLLRRAVADGLPINIRLDSLHLEWPLRPLREHPGLRSLLREGR